MRDYEERRKKVREAIEELAGGDQTGVWRELLLLLSDIAEAIRDLDCTIDRK